MRILPRRPTRSRSHPAVSRDPSPAAPSAGTTNKVRKVRRRDPEPSPWKSSVATTPPTSRDRLRFSSSSSPSSRRVAAGERKVPRREPRRHWRGYYRGSPRATPTPRGRSRLTSRRPWPGFATSTHSRRGYLARRRWRWSYGAARWSWKVFRATGTRAGRGSRALCTRRGRRGR